MFSYLRRALSWLPTAGVLAALLGVGLWGSAHDWKPSSMLRLLFPEPEGKKKAPEKPPENPSESPGDVRLDSPEAGEHAGIESAAARRQPPSRSVEAHAVLAYDQTRYAQLAPRASGTAWRVPRKPGDRVRKGDLLALVSSPEASKARADFLSALVQHDMRGRTLARIKAASGALPERQVFDAQLALREANVQLVNAQQTLVNLGLPVKPEDLKGMPDEEVARKVRLLGMPPELAGEDGLPASLLPIVAPFDGLIIRRDLVVGETAGPDKPAFILADVSRLWVQLDVRQEDVDRLTPGQTVTFESSATGEQAEGVLRWISAEVDPRTRTVRARAEEVANPAGRLRPATFGKARVHIPQKDDVLTVPTAALQWDGQARRVFVYRDASTYEPRFVLPGTTSGGRTELLDPRLVLAAGLPGQGLTPLAAAGWLRAAESVLVPLAPGEKVATAGSHVLKSEMLKSRIGGED
jgi:cobalt-zinc-cadmium efflux system membrane fusion protein